MGDINESYEDELEDEPSNIIDLLIAGDASGNLHLRFYFNLFPKFNVMKREILL